MFPSSPVSVGMFPSNRTLDAELLQTVFTPTDKQFLGTEDPLTVTKVGVERKYLLGITRIFKALG